MPTRHEDGRCWRHRVVRVSRRPSSRDRVSPDVYEQVRSRDGGCVGPRVGFPGECSGPIELDHVLNGGMAYRGPSTVENLASLCSTHHRWKTENARSGRAMLSEYLDARR